MSDNSGLMPASHNVAKLAKNLRNLNEAKSGERSRLSLEILKSLASPTSTKQALKEIKSTSDLGALIRNLRKARKHSQQNFADLAGVGRRFLSELENGKQTLEIGKVIQVITAAGIDLFAKER
jgi:HTH-type transcriptional regulator/antitoxin HipB